MSYMRTIPEFLSTAAADIGGIGSALSDASLAAADPTTNLLAAAADEVSTVVSKVFGGYGLSAQAVLTQASAFHNEFTELLANAGGIFAQAEVDNAEALTNAVGEFSEPFIQLWDPAYTYVGSNIATGPNPQPNEPSLTPEFALIMGGTFDPQPFPLYVTTINNAFIQPFFPGATSVGLSYPAQFWPLTSGLTLNQSVAEGVIDLNNALSVQINGGQHVINFGFSQSAVVATQEMQRLMALPVDIRPDPSDLSFVLAGNPATPNGGIFIRFPGMHIPFVDLTFTSPTPPDTPYPTTIYATQYDPTSDFPRYPLNILSDLNTLMSLGHHELYPNLDVSNAVQLPTSPDYTGNTTYYMFMTKNLPLLEPVRAIPFIGNPIADFIQPDLRVLVDLGYSDWGSGQDYANVPTPATLFPIPNPFVIGTDLVIGAVHGSTALAVDLGLLPASALPNAYPYLPSLDTDLNFFLGQPGVTVISLVTNAIGPVLQRLPAINPG